MRNLVPGIYTVTVSAPEFSTFIRSDLVLNVGSEMVVNAQLVPGQVNEKVEDTGEAPNVELSGSSLGDTVRGGTIRELPLNGRDWSMLATLEPSVSMIRTEKAVANNTD